MREIKFRAWDGDTSLGYKQNGYQLRKAPKGHPYANKRGYLMEHRLVIERSINRYLIPRKEIVHHINGVKDDNRLENLQLTNPKDHPLCHIGSRNKNGRFVCLSPQFDEIKFRFFDKDRNLISFFTLGQLISKTFRRGKFEFRGRFTGLKDKNGKEIYEGDIVGGFPHGTVTVEWDSEYSCFISVWNEDNFDKEGEPITIKRSSLFSNDLKDCKDAWEVLGNIYENH